MDFEIVLKKLTSEFKKNNIRYALMGGFAIGLWGIIRATGDLDFLVRKDDSSKLDAILKSLGYKCYYKTENVAQYVSDLKIFGAVDIIYAFREYSLNMLQRAEKIFMPDGEYELNILKAEDIIGLKIQAAANDETRRAREHADIEELFKKFAGKMDWNLLKEYFSLFGLEDKLAELERKYKNAE